MWIAASIGHGAHEKRKQRGVTTAKQGSSWVSAHLAGSALRMHGRHHPSRYFLSPSLSLCRCLSRAFCLPLQVELTLVLSSPPFPCQSQFLAPSAKNDAFPSNSSSFRLAFHTTFPSSLAHPRADTMSAASPLMLCSDSGSCVPAAMMTPPSSPPRDKAAPALAVGFGCFDDFEDCLGFSVSAGALWSKKKRARVQERGARKRKESYANPQNGDGKSWTSSRAKRWVGGVGAAIIAARTVNCGHLAAASAPRIVL